jgi:hypothetical protein
MLMLKFMSSDLQVLLMRISKSDRLTHSVCHPFGFTVISFLSMRFGYFTIHISCYESKFLFCLVT